MKPGDLVKWTMPGTFKDTKVWDIGLLMEIYAPAKGLDGATEIRVLFSYGEDIVDMANCTVLSTNEER